MFDVDFTQSASRIPAHLARSPINRPSFAAAGLAMTISLSLLPTGQAQCPTSFGNPADFAVGGNAKFVATSDLNNDDNLDLIVANWNGGTVSVLLGLGNGNFSAAVNYASGNPNAVALGDVNNDGVPDLAVAQQGNTASVRLGNGDGTFGAATSYVTGNPSTPVSVAIGDLNGDGKPDLAVANYSSRTVSVLLGNGNGTFAAPVNYNAGGASPSSLAMGDLNGDDRPDLAVSNFGSTVSVLLNNGNGTYAAPVQYPTGTSSRSVAIGDVSGDGRPDLAVANQNSEDVSVLLGNGDGTFSAAVNFPVGGQPYSVAIGDLNADGRPDLAVASSVGATMLQGVGNGYFVQSSSDALTGAQSLAIGDFNNDTKPDLAVTNNYSTVSRLRNNGGSIWITQQPANQTVAEGQNATFSISNTGSPSFRWRHNGVPLTDGGRISGATTNTLSIAGALAADAGVYDVQLTASCNAVNESQPAALSVQAPSCRGDFNNDDHFDALDIQPIIDALLANETCP